MSANTFPFLPQDTCDAPADTLVWASPAVTPGTPGQLLHTPPQASNAVVALLLACFVLLALIVRRYAALFARRARAFLHTPRSQDQDGDEPGEGLVLVVMAVLNCLFMALLPFFYVLPQATATPPPYAPQPPGPPLLLAALTGLLAAYYALKWALASTANTILFGGKKALQWLHDMLFVTALQAALAFPVLLLVTFFALPLSAAAYGLLTVACMAKMAAFYRAWLIFFRQKGGAMPSFLYFCTLEIAPLLAFVGVVRMAASLLSVNI